MAENLVVRSVLTEDMVKAGARLTEALDEGARFAEVPGVISLPVAASLWFLDDDQWKLIIASAEVEKEGPKKAYRHVLTVMSYLEDDLPKISIQDLMVTDTKHPLIRLLSEAASTGPHDLSAIRITDNVVNGTWIDDAYVYRMSTEGA